MTIAAANGGRQRTSTDGLPQATRAAALVSRVATWLRDEEAEQGSAPNLTVDISSGAHATLGSVRRIVASVAGVWPPRDCKLKDCAGSA
jgi:hypothetical protein